ncbi:MAG: pilus assembly PilX N-terminal domain-containing protein [Gemmatimonadales bacterium]
MKRILRDERGMALAVAIFALVVVGALVAGAFFAGTQEQRVGENQRRVQTSFGVAEAGAQERVLTWDPTTMNKRAQYPSDSVVIGPNSAAPNGTGSYGGYSYRLGPNIFLIDITGRDRTSAAGAIAGGGGARQRIGMITRIAPVDFGIHASLTTQGSVAVSGNANVNGSDQTPTGWASCDPPGPSQAGVRDLGGTVSTSGTSTVQGNPPVVNDPSINNNTFTTFGGATYAQLAARANITLPGGNLQVQPSVINGVCNKNDLANWGDGDNPNAPCGSYFPIIHITGNATLNGVQGQGILLVDGTLTIAGGFNFYGITIIQGDLITSGGGNTDAHFWGGVMAKNADLSTQTLSGHATLNYSSCSIVASLQAISPISMMRSRGWVQLY